MGLLLLEPQGKPLAFPSLSRFPQSLNCGCSSSEGSGAVALICSLVMVSPSQLGWGAVASLATNSLLPQGMCLQSPGYYQDRDIWRSVNSSTAQNAAGHVAVGCVSLWVSETGVKSCLANRAHQTSQRRGDLFPEVMWIQDPPTLHLGRCIGQGLHVT